MLAFVLGIPAIPTTLRKFHGRYLQADTKLMIRAGQRNHLFNDDDLIDAASFANAVCQILGNRYPEFDEATVRKAFGDIEDAYFGRFPGLLACDTPYHDLRHSLDTSLVMARMVDGFEISCCEPTQTLKAEEGCLAVLLALYHDVGFLRREDEAALHGASLVHEHEQRSVDFMHDYLRKGAFSHLSSQAALIHATDFAKPIAETLMGLPRQWLLIGQMLGTADLLSQISGLHYLQNCRDFLYQEFAIAGVDKKTMPSGETIVLYASPEDLLRKTPQFYEHVVRKRLEEDFEQVYRYLVPHFGGDNPHILGMQRNMAFLHALIQRDDFSALGRDSILQMPVTKPDQA